MLYNNTCMYICIYLYIYKCIHRCTYMCTYICIYIYIICGYIHTCLFVHVYIFIHIHLYNFSHEHVYTIIFPFSLIVFFPPFFLPTHKPEDIEGPSRSLKKKNLYFLPLYFFLTSNPSYFPLYWPSLIHNLRNNLKGPFPPRTYSKKKNFTNTVAYIVYRSNFFSVSLLFYTI